MELRADTTGEATTAAPAALNAWRAALGEDQVAAVPAICDRFARSLAPHGTRPLCVLRPRHVGDVSAALRIAGDHGIAIHPVATGRNWGYGEACAPHAGMAILDLSGMNRIVEINRQLGYVVIEPGVTQGQLYDAVQRDAPEFWIDCTGAGPDASIVGNALQRGFGHTLYADHVRTQSALEVVLADGRVLHTGFGHLPQARAQHVFPYGLGPYLDGIFTQSNLGVVTRMTVWLQPKPEAFRFFWIRVTDESKLGALIEALRPLRMAGKLRSALHIGNDLRVISASHGYPWERTATVPLPDDVRAAMRNEMGCGAWNASGSLTGTQAEVRAAARALRRAVQGIGRVVLLGDVRLRLLQAARGWMRRTGIGRGYADAIDRLEENYALLQGQPTRGPLRGMLWRLRHAPEGEVRDLLDTNAGLRWIAPVLPFTAEDAARVIGIVAPHLASFGFDLMLTFTALNERAMVCIINVSFDRTQPTEVTAADSCHAALSAALRAEGYYPYRESSLGHRWSAGTQDTFVEVSSAIKRALDPRETLSPGLYIPPQG